MVSPARGVEKLVIVMSVSERVGEAHLQVRPAALFLSIKAQSIKTL